MLNVEIAELLFFPVSFEDFFADDKKSGDENIVEIVFVSGKQKMSREEMAISERLDGLTDIYAA